MKEAVITSSVLVIGILLLRRVLRGKISARLQYALWLLVALRLILPATAAVFPEADMIPKSNFSIMNMAQKMESAVDTYLTEPDIVVSQALPLSGLPLLKESETDKNTNILYAFCTLLDNLQSGKWDNLLHKIWFIGIGAAMLWMLYVNLVFTRHLHQNRKPYPAEGQKLPVYLVSPLESPCLYGFFEKNAVYLTKDIAEDEKKCRHILAHEYCHLKHGDIFWSLLRCVLLAVYWFHPFVWVAAVVSQRDCELACDEAAIQVLGEEERIPYGRTLVALVERNSRVSNLFCTATNAASGKKGITQRVQQIAQKPRMLMAAVLFTVIAMGIAVIVTFTGAKASATTANKKVISEIPSDGIITTDSLQITFPEKLTEKMVYTIENQTDILVFDKQSKQEIGRFCVIPWEEAVQLADQREIVTLGEYGSNGALNAHIKGENTQHNYTTNNNSNKNNKGDDTDISEKSIKMESTINNEEIEYDQKGDFVPVFIPDESSSKHTYTPNNSPETKSTNDNKEIEYDQKEDFDPISIPDNNNSKHTYTPYETMTMLLDEDGETVVTIGGDDIETFSGCYLTIQVDDDMQYRNNIQRQNDIQISLNEKSDTKSAEDNSLILAAPKCYLYIPADYSKAEKPLQKDLAAASKELAALAEEVTILTISTQSMESAIDTLVANRGHLDQYHKIGNILRALPDPEGYICQLASFGLSVEKKSEIKQDNSYYISDSSNPEFVFCTDSKISCHYAKIDNTSGQINEDIFFADAVLLFATIDGFAECEMKNGYNGETYNYNREEMEALFGALYPASQTKEDLTTLYNQVVKYLSSQTRENKGC